jgi:WD40 repeat protein
MRYCRAQLCSSGEEAVTAHQLTDGEAAPPDPWIGRRDVFVSYAREDAAFALRLKEGLERAAKQVWIDSDAIPKGAEWWARVEAGIESARAVVAVLSPDFAESTVCEREIGYAVEHGKRLLPVVQRDVDGAAFRPELEAVNWIFVDGASLDGTVAELLEALDTDFDWLERHAQLLERALEWSRADDKARPSLLLRGSALRGAERFLDEQEQHAEQATREQVDYVLASRRSSVRRQRVTFAAVAAALAVSIGLSIFALVQRSQAVTRAEVAQSQALAAQADEQLSADPAAALALAVRAMRTRSTFQARDALRRAYLTAPLLSVRCVPDVERLDDLGCGASLSPDGEYVLSTGGMRPRLWSIQTGRAVATLGAGIDERDAAFSPDGRLVATEDQHHIRVWSVPDGKQAVAIPTSIRITDFANASFLFDPDGRLFAVSDDRGTTLFDDRTWKVVDRFPHEHAVTFRPNGEVLALRTRKAFVFRRAGNWRQTATLAVATPRHIPDEGAFSPGGRLFAGTWVAAGYRSTSGWGVQTPDDFTVVGAYDMARRRVVHLFGHLSSFTNTPTFSPDGRLLALFDSGRGMTMWSTHTWRTAYTTSLDAMSHDWRLGVRDDAGNEGARDLVDVSDGRRLAVLTTDSPKASVVFGDHGLVATAGDDGFVRVWHPVVPRVWSRQYVPFRGEAPNIFGVAFSRDRRLAAVAIESEPVRVLGANGSVVRVSDTQIEASDLSFSPDGRYLVASDAVTSQCDSRCRDGGLEIRSAPVWTLAARFATAPGATWSTDGRYLAIWGGTSTANGLRKFSRIRLMSAGTWTPVRTRPGAGADISADDTSVVSTNHGRAIVWNAVEGTPTETIREPGDAIASAKLGPDRQIVTIDDSGGVRVWSSAGAARVLHVTKPTALGVLSADKRLLALTSRDGQQTTVYQTQRWKALGTFAGIFAAFSRDDRLMLTQTRNDHVAHVWETQSGDAVMDVTGVGGFQSGAFTPDGRSVVTVGTDARARTYPCPVCGPVAQIEANAEHRIEG